MLSKKKRLIVAVLIQLCSYCGAAGAAVGFPDLDLTANRAASSASSSRNRVLRQPTRPLVTPSQCSFGRGRELNSCGWNETIGNGTSVEHMNLARIGGLSWQLSSGREAFFRGGPSVDAAGDLDGGYLLLETSQGGDPVTLFGPMLKPTRSEGRCVVLEYVMDGPSAERLRLVIHQPQPVIRQTVNDTFVLIPRRETLWETRDGTGDQWQTIALLYSYGQQHQLVVEAGADDSMSTQKRMRGHIALDNVDLGTWRDVEGDEDSSSSNSVDQDQLLSNPCMGHCNFDGGFCGWSNDQDDEFDWELGRGSVNGATGPTRDRSTINTGEPSRGYAFINSGHPRVPGDAAILLSPQMTATDPDRPVCFKFWTHLFGNGIGSLKVHLVTRLSGDGIPVRKEVWSLTGEAGNSWHQGQLTIASPIAFRIAFEGVVGRNHLGDIAIDDISFVPGPCPSLPQAAAQHQGDCNFEADECGWMNAGAREGADEIDWTRVPAENSRLPPFKDHTTFSGKGYVMSPARGSVQRPGDRAWLVSRPFNVTAGQTDRRCITFWYFMNEPIIDPAGPSLGSLRIYIRKEDPSGTVPAQQTLIWRLQNHQGGSWKLGRALIEQSNSYRVVIEGMWGSSRSAGTIAIDDISFYEGQCNTSPRQAIPSLAECSFDRDTCGWRNNATTPRPDSLEWRLATASRRPANLPDHSFAAPSGYVYFDVFSQQTKQELVRLVGPNVTFNGGDGPRLCFTFWFAAFGAGDTTQLRILTLDSNSKSEREIWALKVAQLERSDWNFGQVGLDGTGSVEDGQSRVINIIFEGRASNGGFAVDDIYFYTGGCKTRPPFATPSS